MVEHATENRGVGSSTLPLGTLHQSAAHFVYVGEVHFDQLVAARGAVDDLDLARPQAERFGKEAFDGRVGLTIDGGCPHPYAQGAIGELDSVGPRIRVSFNVDAHLRSNLEWHDACADMDHQAVASYCRGLAGANEGYPFGAGVLVFKVGTRIFAILAEQSVSLKCDPVIALALRENYRAVTAGYHLNKRHWNTVELDASVPDDELCDWIQDSYALALASLPRAERQALSK